MQSGAMLEDISPPSLVVSPHGESDSGGGPISLDAGGDTPGGSPARDTSGPVNTPGDSTLRELLAATESPPTSVSPPIEHVTSPPGDVTGAFLDQTRVATDASPRGGGRGEGYAFPVPVPVPVSTSVRVTLATNPGGDSGLLLQAMAMNGITPPLGMVGGPGGGLMPPSGGGLHHMTHGPTNHAGFLLPPLGAAPLTDMPASCGSGRAPGLLIHNHHNLNNNNNNNNNNKHAKDNTAGKNHTASTDAPMDSGGGGGGGACGGGGGGGGAGGGGGGAGAGATGCTGGAGGAGNHKHMGAGQTKPPSHVVRQCAGCGGHIVDRFLLHAIDRYWHVGCLKCSCCQAQLGEIGTSCFTKAGMILCKNDYIRLFGCTGTCAACGQAIPAQELVMRAQGNVYHVNCFTCVTCHSRLCPGDRYSIVNGNLLCEHDYPKVIRGHIQMPVKSSHKVC